MKALLKAVLVCALIWPLSYTVSAQAPATPCSPKGGGPTPSQMSSVSGCPLSANIEIERSQTLADGTHVQTNTRAHSYRDSRDRIRYESYPPANIGKDVPEAPTMIVIYDPVDGFDYMLLPQTARAYRYKLPENASRPGGCRAAATCGFLSLPA
jgi:hypothetical protein